MDSALKRVCMRDRIRDVLVARILDGTYPAGQQLKELTLAREFNVSQAPQCDPATHVPVQRVPELQKGAVAAHFHQAAMEIQRPVDVLLGVPDRKSVV